MTLTLKMPGGWAGDEGGGEGGGMLVGHES